MSSEEFPSERNEDAADAKPSSGEEMSGRGGGRGHHRRHSRRRASNTGFQSTGGANAPRGESGMGSVMNMDELRDLVELIAAHGFTDFELESEGFRVRLRRETSSPGSAGTESGASQNLPATAPNASQNLTTQSPIVNLPPASSQAANLQGGASSAPPAGATAPSDAVAEKGGDANLHDIVSPIVGTFYRASAPTSPAFVNIGDTIKESSVVCIVEAMKLMNEIQAETSGVIEKIYVENGQPVEFGQPLFGVRR